MSNAEELQGKLSDPFLEDDIEWRVQQSGIGKNGKPWVMVIPYLTNRAVQQRLDDVFGFGCWENEYRPTPDGKGYLCGIRVMLNDKWITKWDGAELTQVEALKGGLSNSMKRAAVQWGIGRYLYNLETEFALASEVASRFDVSEGAHYIKVKDKRSNATQEAQWWPPQLPAWALPRFEADTLIEGMEKANSLDELKAIFKEAYSYANSFSRNDLSEKFTEIKDRRKADLIKRDQKENAKDIHKVESWLQMKIINEVRPSLNLSVLAQHQSTTKKELGEKVTGDIYRKLLSQLNEACKETYDKLNNGDSNE